MKISLDLHSTFGNFPLIFFSFISTPNCKRTETLISSSAEKEPPLVTISHLNFSCILSLLQPQYLMLFVGPPLVIIHIASSDKK